MFFCLRNLYKGVSDRKIVIGFLLCCILYFLINALYLIKYGARYTSYYPIIVLIYAIFLIGFIFFKHKNKPSLKQVVILLAVNAIAIIILQMHIDPYSIKVDRWSAIHNFLTYLLAGEYPYAAQTHLGGYGSPFPVWQLFHLPFYLLGNVGLSLIVAVIIFAYSVWLLSPTITTKVLCLLFMAPAFWYEASVRSDLLANFLICCSVINFIWVKHIPFEKSWAIIGLLCGLLLSTRLSTIIPLSMFLFQPFLALPARKRIYFLTIVFLAFAITFLPFIFLDSEMLFFFKYNPFILQTRQGNILDFLIFLPIGIYWSMKWWHYKQYMEYSAYILGILVVVTFLHNMWIRGEWCEFFDLYDITYFNMMLPFLILAMQSTGTFASNKKKLINMDKIQ